MEDTKKRQRSKNFTPTEVAVLAEEMKIHGAQVAAKHSSGGPDAVTKKTQDRLWSKITASVNSAGVCCRSVGEVREKWRNLQRKAKAEFTAERISVLKTGGGPPLQSQSCGVTRDLIDLMKDRSSFSGIPGAQDSETVIFTFEQQKQDDEHDEDDDETEVSFLDQQITSTDLVTELHLLDHKDTENQQPVASTSMPIKTDQSEGSMKESKGRKRSLKEMQMEFYSSTIAINNKKSTLIDKQAAVADNLSDTLIKVNLMLDKVLDTWMKT